MLDQDNVVALLGAEVFTLTSNVAEIEAQVADTAFARSAAEISQLLEERSEAYGRFTTVDTSGLTATQVIDALRNAGASIPADPASELDDNEETVNRIFMIIIAGALAVLVVVLFLVLTF